MNVVAPPGEIPPFDEAAEQMQAFLARNDRPTTLAWLFRDDLFSSRPTSLFVITPLPGDGASLAQKVYEEGAQRGLVEMRAVGALGSRALTTVWYPRSEDDVVQGWTRGFKLSLDVPFPSARPIPAFAGGLLRVLPAYRRFQKHSAFIGTRAWAGARA